METQNIFIVHPHTDEQVNALKAFMKALKITFEVTGKEAYDPEFVAKIEKSRQDYKEGKGTTITIDELDALWK